MPKFVTRIVAILIIAGLSAAPAMPSPTPFPIGQTAGSPRTAYEAVFEKQALSAPLVDALSRISEAGKIKVTIGALLQGTHAEGGTGFGLAVPVVLGVVAAFAAAMILPQSWHPGMHDNLFASLPGLSASVPFFWAGTAWDEITRNFSEALPGPRPGSEPAQVEPAATARAMAEPFKRMDLAALWALTDPQQQAKDHLADYPPDLLLDDFLTFAYGTEAYQLTVAALCLNGNIESYRKARVLYGGLTGDLAKRHDLVKILRNIQINASYTLHDLLETLQVVQENPHVQNFLRSGKLLPIVNRKTFDGRTIPSFRIIDEALRSLPAGHPAVIGDMAGADETSAWELARHLTEGPDADRRNVLVIGYDKTLSVFRFQAVDGTVFYFRPDGQAWQVIRNGVLVKAPLVPPEALIQLEKGWTQVDRSQVENISLINPEAQAYADQHPDRLRFEVQDVFEPLQTQHDFIRVLGLLFRGPISYFSDDRIKYALANLGGGVLPGRWLLNGVYGPGGQAAYDFYQRKDGFLRLLTSVGYGSTAGWERFRVGSPPSRALNKSA